MKNIARAGIIASLAALGCATPRVQSPPQFFMKYEHISTEVEQSDSAHPLSGLEFKDSYSNDEGGIIAEITNRSTWPIRFLISDSSMLIAGKSEPVAVFNHGTCIYDSVLIPPDSSTTLSIIRGGVASMILGTSGIVYGCRKSGILYNQSDADDPEFRRRLLGSGVTFNLYFAQKGVQVHLKSTHKLMEWVPNPAWERSTRAQ